MAKWESGVCLVTGGAGFLGRYLVQALLKKQSDIKIKVLARSEKEMAELLVACANNSRITPILGDIQDTDALEFALDKVGVVIHLAAMKHIDFCEKQPTLAIKTNVIAAMNLLDLSKGDTFIGMSTDKVFGMKLCYGATKSLLESMILERATNNPNKRHMAIRSGNIFNSSGSVIPKWIEQIKQRNEIMVTDLGMTRFFIKADVLADFIVWVIEQGQNGKVYIPTMASVKLADLAKAVIETYGNEKTKIKVTGARKSESRHERILLNSEENILTNMAFETSDCGGYKSPFLSVKEIKEWLKE